MRRERIKQKLSLPHWAMRYREVIILLAACLVAFGVYALRVIDKDEFPSYTIREGVVAAFYPGATSQEVEEQVTKPLEDFIFQYKDVNKERTTSLSRDGLSVITLMLNEDQNDKNGFYNKLRHDVAAFAATLPDGVALVDVNDDFGDVSALLITMESDSKTYRELSVCMDILKDSLRTIQSVGKMDVYGMQKEQISVKLDGRCLAQYGLTDFQIAQTMTEKGYVTTAGRRKTESSEFPIYVSRSVNQMGEIGETVVYSDPQSDRSLRLKDVATIVREYPEPESFITSNGRKCLVLSVAKKDGEDISAMGAELKAKLAGVQRVLPADVHIAKINDKSEIVDQSVRSFLLELLIAIVTVILVVVILMPMRVALVATSTIPVTIFASLGVFYVAGMEINTVTLAALIVTLGMIVDDSIVIIDGYVDFLSKGMSRWHATILSAEHFFKSIFSATLAISITFFPFLVFMSGGMSEFLFSFPWGMTIILFISMLVAQLYVPIVQFFFIRKPVKALQHAEGDKPVSLLNFVQDSFDKLIDICFKHKKATLWIGAATVLLGIFLFMKVPQELMPAAQRDQFAVEIITPSGTSLNRTAAIADSLEHMMLQDSRITTVTAFKGTPPPRFVDGFAPGPGGTNYAEFIVNTRGADATEELLPELREQYSGWFPDAFVQYKQISYSYEANPVEVRVTSSDREHLHAATEEVTELLRRMPELYMVRSDFREPLPGTMIRLDEESASRLGVTNKTLEETLWLRYGEGLKLGTSWDGKYGSDIVLKSATTDRSSVDDILDEDIPAYGGISTVKLRQVASAVPVWQDGEIHHRNGLPTATVMAEVTGGKNVMEAAQQVRQKVSTLKLPADVQISLGGKFGEEDKSMPEILKSLLATIVIIFFILLWHFKEIRRPLLLMACLPFCILGTAVGLLVTGSPFSLTSVLGIISLMGILVRDGIILFDFAKEIRDIEGLSVEESVIESSKRRMRAILLTCLAASVGVVPMILAGSTLWKPMASVICFGTLVTLVYIRTVMPVLYSLIIKK